MKMLGKAQGNELSEYYWLCKERFSMYPLSSNLTDVAFKYSCWSRLSRNLHLSCFEMFSLRGKGSCYF